MRSLVIFFGLLYVSLTAFTQEASPEALPTIRILSPSLGAFVQYKPKNEVGFYIRLCYANELIPSQGCVVSLKEIINEKPISKIWVMANYGREYHHSIFMEGASSAAGVEVEIVDHFEGEINYDLYFTDQSENNGKLYIKTADNKYVLAPPIKVARKGAEIRLNLMIPQ